MADNYTAERTDRPIVKADYFDPMNYTSSFAEIRPRFSRSRDPIYVTPGRGTKPAAHRLAGYLAQHVVYIEAARSF